MVPGLTGAKMSSSDPKSKLDLLDSAEVVKNKIYDAYCREGDLVNNGPLAFSKMVLFPIFQSQRKPLIVSRPEKHGGDLKYDNYEQMESDFVKKDLHPLDLKNAVATHINALLSSIRRKFEDPVLRDLTLKAYPGSIPSSFDEKNESDEKNENGKAAGKRKAKGKSPAEKEDDINKLDLRVGEIMEAEKHPVAEKLLIEKINVGEAEPRTIVSGIAGFYDPADLIGKKVVVVCNLKPKKLVKVESNGMVLAASTEDHLGLELLEAPLETPAGTKIKFEGLTTSDDRPTTKANETVMKMFNANAMTNEQSIATYKGVAFSAAEGLITVNSLTNSKIQ